HGEEGRAKLHDALDALADGIADIVQLEIEEDLLAALDEIVGEREPARIAELIADLVERHAVAELPHHALGVRDRRQVERDDDAAARIGRRVHAICLAISISRCTTPRNAPALRSSFRCPSSSKASAAPRTAICSGITS